MLIVWRRDLARSSGWSRCRAWPWPRSRRLRGVHDHDSALVAVGRGVLALRAASCRGCWPRGRPPNRDGKREATPLVNTASSLLVAAGADPRCLRGHPAAGRRSDTAGARDAVPAAFAVVLIALFVMVTRRRAVSQAVGFLMLDNGIAAAAFLFTAGVPLIVELGASLDVLFAVIVIGVLTGRLRGTFGDTDLDELRELRD